MTAPVVDTSQAGADGAAVCVHHWVLDASLDNVARGICRACGATRTFTPQRAARHHYPPRQLEPAP